MRDIWSLRERFYKVLPLLPTFQRETCTVVAATVESDLCTYIPLHMSIYVCKCMCT